MTASDTNPLEVSAHEFGTVRVFTTALDAEDASNITAANVHKLLGDVTLRPEKVEIVPTRALEGLGLTGYLREGYGVPAAAMAGRAAQLDAISGMVVLIPASAFDGGAQTIDPHPSMRFVGLFREESAAPPRQMETPESAKDIGTPPSEGGRQSSSISVRNSWIIALGSLLIAAALILLFVT